MEDYVRKIVDTLSEKLGKNNVVARYDMEQEMFYVVVKNVFGLTTYTLDRDWIEYEFDETMETILRDYVRLG